MDGRGRDCVYRCFHVFPIIFIIFIYTHDFFLVSNDWKSIIIYRKNFFTTYTLYLLCTSNTIVKQFYFIAVEKKYCTLLQKRCTIGILGHAELCKDIINIQCTYTKMCGKYATLTQSVLYKTMIISQCVYVREFSHA